MENEKVKISFLELRKLRELALYKVFELLGDTTTQAHLRARRFGQASGVAECLHWIISGKSFEDIKKTIEMIEEYEK